MKAHQFLPYALIKVAMNVVILLKWLYVNVQHLKQSKLKLNI